MRHIRIIFGFFLAVSLALLPAQESQQEEGSASTSGNSLGERLRFRGRSIVLDINARIVEPNQTVTWNESHRKVTIPGRSVGIKLAGANVVVSAQFTPYIRQRGLQRLLVAQGEVWMEVPDQGIRYFTSMQTIPMEFGEPVYFFPLGLQAEGDSARIEIMITLNPHEE